MKKIGIIVLSIIVVFLVSSMIIKDKPDRVKAENVQTTGIQNTQNLAYDIVVSKKDKDNQVIETNLRSFGYPILVVEKGVPVKWTMSVEENNLTACNNQFYIPEFQLQKDLVVGTNEIEFTPTETGIVDYQCWMGMIRSNIVVVDDVNNIDIENIQKQLASQPRRGGCCGD